MDSKCCFIYLREEGKEYPYKLKLAVLYETVAKPTIVMMNRNSLPQ